MTQQEKDCIKHIKHQVNNGLSMAEAFLKVFENYQISEHKKLMEAILNRFSSQDLQLGECYFFIDGSRFNMDITSDCMLATKGYGNHLNK